MCVSFDLFVLRSVAVARAGPVSRVTTVYPSVRVSGER